MLAGTPAPVAGTGDAPAGAMALPALRAAPDVIARTVAGMGYDLVEVERGPRGLLRVTIDRVPGRAYPAAGGGEDLGAFVTVDDCERVTRQLQYALEADGLAYERLEVSSPGLDRLLRHAADFERFAGEQVTLTLRQPFQGRRHWMGRLLAQDPPSPTAWRLVLTAAGAEAGAAVQAARRGKSGRSGKGGKPAADAPAPAQVLDFRLDELREARLVPVLDFKGRGRTPAGGPGDGGQER